MTLRKISMNDWVSQAINEYLTLLPDYISENTISTSIYSKFDQILKTFQEKKIHQLEILIKQYQTQHVFNGIDQLDSSLVRNLNLKHLKNAHLKKKIQSFEHDINQSINTIKIQKKKFQKDNLIYSRKLKLFTPSFYDLLQQIQHQQIAVEKIRVILTKKLKEFHQYLYASSQTMLMKELQKVFLFYGSYSNSINDIELLYQNSFYQLNQKNAKIMKGISTILHKLKPIQWSISDIDKCLKYPNTKELQELIEKALLKNKTDQINSLGFSMESSYTSQIFSMFKTHIMNQQSMFEQKIKKMQKKEKKLIYALKKMKETEQFISQHSKYRKTFSRGENFLMKDKEWDKIISQLDDAIYKMKFKI